MLTRVSEIHGDPTIHMEEMTWEEYAARVGGGAVVLLPCGAVEQHGPHLPLKADAFIATKLAERVAREIHGLVAPCFMYGHKSQALSGGGQIFPGTTSLDAHTIACVVRDVLRELLRHGVRRVLVLNGHGENAFPLYEGVDLALREARPDGVKVVVTGWWQLIPEARIRELFPGEFPGWDLEHGAITETSLMLALDRDAVRTERIRDETMPFVPGWSTFPQPPDLIPRSGLMSGASAASARLGEQLLETILAGMRELIRREFATPP